MKVNVNFVGQSYDSVIAQYDCYEEEDFIIIGDVYGDHYELSFEKGLCIESEYIEGED